MRWAVFFLIWTAVLFGIWFVLVDSLAHIEVAVGPLAALLAAWAALRLRRHGGARFRARLGWVVMLRSVPVGILRDTGVVWFALCRRLILRQHMRSVFRAVPYQACADGATARAWRALTIAGTSLTPNTIVIGIDCERGVALVHQLIPDSPARLRHTVIGAGSTPERRPE